MTLMFGCLAGLVLGLALGLNRWTVTIAGLVWYVTLAAQTAYLAHADVTGFFGLNGLETIQGGSFAQYWILQPVILAVIVALVWLGSRLRRLAGRMARRDAKATA